MQPFLDSLKKELEAKVSDVRVSSRLIDSPCCLVQRENAIPPSMVRMMRAMRQDVPEDKRILEINPSHPLIAKIRALEGDQLKDSVALLYDSALIAEGSPVEDGARFAKLLAELMLK
jgi:molecular chaperone HtpG